MVLIQAMPVQGYASASECPAFVFSLDGVVASLLHLVQQQHHQLTELSEKLISSINANANGSCALG
jgi:hypothetical protein